MRRRFEVIPTSVQSFEDRFTGKRRRLDDDVPQPAHWRCNLTGLSQKHNLYFIAYGAEIHVYTPQFPSQAITDPVLIVPCRPTGLGPHGYLDTQQPDCINNLLVAFLGTEEVVATVRDNGDVDAYLIRHIIQAIDSRSDPRTSINNTADELRPLFQRNVGISAWGLAIHSQARIIAVSSNSHQVTVYKFALTANQHPERRHTDVVEQVMNGDANIPSIAFCNTGDDPDARWLLTTDINGVCRTIDLHQAVPSQSFRFGRHLPSVYGAGYDRSNAGWTMMFLDRRSFFDEDTFHGAVGILEHESLPDLKDNPLIWDLSRTVKTLPDTSNAFIRHQTVGSFRKKESHSPICSPRSTTSSHLTDTDIDIDIFEEVSVVDEELESGDESPSGPEVVDDDYDEDEGTEDTIPSTALYGGDRICGNAPRFSRSTALCDNLPCPILHASVRNIYLLQPTISTGIDHWQPPFIGLAAPLKQSIQLEYHRLNMFDRLNMSAYIPALGSVVIASQKGRAIVLALTKVGRAVSYPAGMACFGHKTNYSMRVEAVLPFGSQERLNQRPFAPLHGIAAGPLQGSEGLPDEKKRWRLMLMYQDQSILSYEITRKGDSKATII